MFNQLPKPKNCILWKDPTILASGDGNEFLKYLKEITVYSDTSHFGESLMQCRECGQLYFQQFYEHVDWLNGDDKIYSTYVPVPDEKIVLDNLNNKLPIALLACKPRIQWDNGERPYWIK